MKQKYMFTRASIQALMQEINQQGNFLHTLLTDDQGLPIASSMTDLDQSEVQAALVSMVQKMACQISDSLQMSPTAEFVLNDVEGKRLVIRPFTIQGTEFILTVLISNHQIPYRRLIGSAIKTIKSTWVN